MGLISYLREKFNSSIPIEGVVERVYHDYIGMRKVAKNQVTVYGVRVGEEIIELADTGHDLATKVGETIKGYFDRREHICYIGDGQNRKGVPRLRRKTDKKEESPLDKK